ncbi:MAG: nucleotidyltransferase domain-containing protein [Campylobacteraceae bacterium]|nr:nucleotidyltransferase domain-containing protein [Campylobacteraceae bacterium]
MNSSEITNLLKESKHRYSNEGVNIIGIFGSFSKQTQTDTSDIDIAYTLDKNLFFEKYRGVAAASKIADIKDELARKFHRKVDLLSLENSNIHLVEAIKREMIYV